MARVKDVKRLEELAREKEYTNLRWFSLPDLMKKTKKGTAWERTKFVLCGRPKDYRGPYSDYNETILAQVMDEKRLKTQGYKWTNRDMVTNWVME